MLGCFERFGVGECGLFFFGEKVNRHCRQDDQQYQDGFDQRIRPDPIDQCLEFQYSIDQQHQQGEPADKEYGSVFEFAFL